MILFEYKGLPGFFNPRGCLHFNSSLPPSLPRVLHSLLDNEFLEQSMRQRLKRAGQTGHQVRKRTAGCLVIQLLPDLLPDPSLFPSLLASVTSTSVITTFSPMDSRTTWCNQVTSNNNLQLVLPYTIIRKSYLTKFSHSQS